VMTIGRLTNVSSAPQLEPRAGVQHHLIGTQLELSLDLDPSGLERKTLVRSPETTRTVTAPTTEVARASKVKRALAGRTPKPAFANAARRPA
jgi:hypothetical protein